MKFNKIIKGASIFVLSTSVLAACSGEEATGDYLTAADAEGFLTEDDLNTWAEEQGFVTGADTETFLTEDDLNTWAEEQGIFADGAGVGDDAAAEEVDFGALDPVEVETVYLDPLGWTATEFNDYLLTEYDMGLADFSDFTELEETVGTVEDIQAGL